MATFSQRRVQRLKDMLMKEATDSELDEIRDSLNNRPKKTQANCGLLKLPAELRNIIYEYVAEDAHASCVKAKVVNWASPDAGTQYDRNAQAFQLRDSSGKKIRPGLLGASRELFEEFHPIFYAHHFIDARYYQATCGWTQAKSAALLDALVNSKHSITTYVSQIAFGRDAIAIMERTVESREVKASVMGVHYMKDAAGGICGTEVQVLAGGPPWTSMPSFDQEGALVWKAFHLERSCKDFVDEGYWTLEKEERCSLCISSYKASEEAA